MSEDRDYEKEALADGWNPDFEGEGKKDAKTFVEDGLKINGMLKGKLGRLEERIDSLTRTNADFKKYTDKQIGKERDENKRLIGELEQVKVQAINDADGAKVVEVERQIHEIQSQEQPEGKSQTNAAGDAWFASNSWYAENPTLHAQADGIADQLRSQGLDDQSAFFFQEITSRVKQAFPEEFENPNRKRAGSVEGGGAKEVKDSKDQNWANLPAADKADANRFIKDIPGFTKEQFLEQYEWE